jgi:sarcosine oxidase subunit beta
MEMWRDISALVDDDCGFHANGQIQAAACGEDFDKVRARVAALQSRGYQNECIIDQKDLRALVPGINSALVGGAYAEGDGAADPHRTMKAFRRAALRAGCEIREQTSVCSLKPARGGWVIGTSAGDVHAGQVINAAGAWGTHIAGMAGEYIPLSAKAPMMMVTEPIAPLIRQVIGIVGRRLSFKQTDRGGLVIGGGLPGSFDLQTGSSTVSFRELPEAARAAKELFSSVESVRIVRAWAGIEGMTADRLPVICPSSLMTGLWHVFGFSGHGFQLVPVVGDLVADMALSGKVHPLLSPFSTHRFTG